MSRLNLESLTTFSLLDVIPAPAVPEPSPSGNDSFGALFQRARSTLSQPSSTASSTEDRTLAKDARVRENDGPTEKPRPLEDRRPADEDASREASDEPAEASPSDTAPAAEEAESSEASTEASKESEAADDTEVKSEEDSTEVATGEETSDESQDTLLPAESSSTVEVPAADTSTKSDSAEEAEAPSDEESGEDDEAAAALAGAAAVDGIVPAPPGESDVASEGDPDLASGMNPTGLPVGGPIRPKQTAGATGQPAADPAAAVDSAASTGEDSTTEGAPTSQGQSETAQMPPSEVIDSEGAQGEDNSDQSGDGGDRPSHRNAAGKGIRNSVADQEASTSTTGQGGVLPQANTLSQAGATASQVASSAAATAASTATSDAVPAESKGSGAGTSEVSGGQQATQGQASRGSSTQASADQTGVNQADRVRFVQRVARAVASAGDQGGTIRLRLHPAELGSLRLEVTVRDGAMTARVEAETTAAQGMLLENLPALRERLAEQNIRVERFDVDVMGQSSGGTANGADAQGQSDQGQAQQRPPYNDYRGKAVESSPESRRAVTAGGVSRFDVIV